MGVLVEVHALAGGIGGDEEDAAFVLLEGLLGLLAILTLGTAVDRNYRVVLDRDAA